jgi:hypothetical protein
VIDDYSSTQELTNHLHGITELHCQFLLITRTLRIRHRWSTLPFITLSFTLSIFSNTSASTMTTNTNADLLATAGVPAFLCPQGTKVHILNLGTMRVDAGW